MHHPVLLNEVIQYLNPRPDENFIDCTIGAGGHSLAILEKNNPGKVLAIDWDEESLQLLKLKIKSQKLKINGRLILVNDNFKKLKEVVRTYDFYPVNGILFDLGLSSWQIEESGRGFSFRKNEPLDMRFSEIGLTAKDVINNSDQEELIKIFQQYGEEKYSRRIAGAIKKTLEPIETTGQLKEVVRRSVPFSRARRGGIDRVLARIFQALRIAVNDELENLKQGLEQALEILKPGGRLVVISFHSLEDRIVKNFFRERASLRLVSRRLKVLTKKPIRPTEKEIENNPRSRSAKLRAVIKR